MSEPDDVTSWSPFSPVCHRWTTSSQRRVDARNVPITNIAPQQVLSACRYMQKVRTVQPQSMFDIKCEGTGTVEAGWSGLRISADPEGRLG